MRIGTNPVKIKQPPLKPPKLVTVVVITHIPYLSGYFKKSLDVLKLSLTSIWDNTEDEYDLLVFDNASCDEVKDYLVTLRDIKKIQYLILSDTNVGIPGAWNVSFQAAPGEFVAFADYDIYFYPGWLQEHLSLFDIFPDVGMVTGTPIRPPIEFSSTTLAWAENNDQVGIQRGVLQSWEDYLTHTKSLGMSLEESQETYNKGEDYLIEYQGKNAFIGAGHFQFVASKGVLDQVGPFPNNIAMGNERLLDQKINELGFLRLCLSNRFVQHLGNEPDQELLAKHKIHQIQKSQNFQTGFAKRLFEVSIIKRSLLKIYNLIFEIYNN
jgi:glycosyltransferase involved in cell wall biosynthesis